MWWQSTVWGLGSLNGLPTILIRIGGMKVCRPWCTHGQSLGSLDLTLPAAAMSWSNWKNCRTMLGKWINNIHYITTLRYALHDCAAHDCCQLLQVLVTSFKPSSHHHLSRHSIGLPIAYIGGVRGWFTLQCNPCYHIIMLHSVMQPYLADLSSPCR